MAPKSSRSSHVSVMSIDPIVASQITGAKSTVQPSHTRAESTPVKMLVASSTSKGHGRNYSVPLKQHKRSNSLRRAKNSTEVLRQRSSKKDRQDSSDHTADSKRGRNFTVTNVGTGGTLYLRPSAHQRPMSPAMSTAPSTTWTAPTTALVMPQDKEAILFSTEQNPLGRGSTVRTRSVSPRRLMERYNKTKEAQSLKSRPSHGRSQSFSTVSESRRSMSDALPKTLKIFINRADQPRPKTTETAKPTLEIPIPHYRLGNPRFSTNGTPILRNSTFTHSSSTPSTRHGSIVKTDGIGSGPPPSSLKAFAKLQPLDLNQTDALGISGVTNPEGPIVRASAVSSIGAAPSIYDELSEVYNDPSVVRFAHDIREVTAATPARIIAQISSESFMDYELVSDFFLTFRSYMSTIDVLDLLLARLKWAIGRMSDDGRIIRIRTFAALRHWILNYFMDDYVPNRYIRERFCDEVNDMYDDVLNQYVGVQSDLKILQDLKRCWNGRCSLYWDGEEFSMDGSPDDEIYPGGVLGSRNPDYISADEVRQIPGQVVLRPAQPTMITVSKRGSPETGKSVPNHQHKPSTASVGPPESLQSDQSFQPNSCSMIIGSKHSSNEKGRPPKGPVPVSVLARRQNAPVELTVTTNLQGVPKSQHRRGGNSIDSTRDRTSVEIPKSAVILPEPHEGSVIRGYVYAPVEPFVQLPANLPQSPSGRFDAVLTSPSTTRLQHEYSLASGNPAVKNIFGSIRRALSGKQGYSEVALITVSTQSSSQTLGGKKSTMPLNVSRSQDELRKNAMRLSPKASIRIDLLCAAAIESYQAAQAAQAAQHQAEPLNQKLAISKPDTLFPPPPVHRHLGKAGSQPSRIPSHGSAESGSILIVNDTDSEIPVMSGAVQVPPRRSSQQTRSSVEHYLPEDRTSFETQIAFQDDGDVDGAGDGDAGDETRITQSSELRPHTPDQVRILSDTASSGTRRNRRSLSSSVAHNRVIGSPGPTASVVTPPQDYHDGTSISSPKTTAHTLRRRPGGDLRKNQNVHDLEPTGNHNHQPSVDSLANTFSTAPDSMLTMENAHHTQQVNTDHVRRVSMINTHSSQHLRPSFEAAVAGFSSIPDDGDGGLEATLLKLEGRYEKSPEIGAHSPPSSNVDRYSAEVPSVQPRDEISSSSPVTGRGYVHHNLPGPINDVELQPHQRSMPIPNLIQKHPVFGLQIQSARSEASTDSVPLLKRDVDSPLPPAFLDKQNGERQQEVIPYSHKMSDSKETNALRAQSPRSYLTADNSNAHSGQSLLPEDQDVDLDDRSDLSSEISVDIINYSEALGSTNSPLLVAPGTAVSGLEIPSHPLAHSSFVNLSLHPSLALDGKNGPVENAKISEPILLKVGNADSKVVRSSSPAQARINMQRGGRISAGPAHMPFVLACDSQMLAQQLTLVEQAALAEIEWSDLVEMRWSSTASSALDWAEYVANQSVKGVDLVITRFNLMVKWALSEIVLTQDVEERVRVITKYIHVAAHARRLHNYATMLQITIALTSTDSTRMSKTWDLVPGPDRSLLKNMESLIQPVRNFHDLRLEMESADLSDGCIPFIGLYIHDLTYNAQKPVEIDIGKGLPPLINFERFRTTATIVKGLLRLIDASSRYDFEPIHGVVERCLWIATLPDERIRSLSRALQQ